MNPSTVRGKNWERISQADKLLQPFSMGGLEETFSMGELEEMPETL